MTWFTETWVVGDRKSLGESEVLRSASATGTPSAARASTTIAIFAAG